MNRVGTVLREQQWSTVLNEINAQVPDELTSPHCAALHSANIF